MPMLKMSAFGGKADIEWCCEKGPFLIQSNFELEGPTYRLQFCVFTLQDNVDVRLNL